MSTQKWYKIELYLQWQTNRKLYRIYRTVPLSVPLNDNLNFIETSNVSETEIDNKNSEHTPYSVV